jgi:hypothetical protein
MFLQLVPPTFVARLDHDDSWSYLIDVALFMKFCFILSNLEKSRKPLDLVIRVGLSRGIPFVGLITSVKRVDDEQHDM